MSVESAIGVVRSLRSRAGELAAPRRDRPAPVARDPLEPGAARVDHVFSTVTRGGEESTRPVLGSKLNTRDVNCTPSAGGRSCWIVAWIACLGSPVR